MSSLYERAIEYAKSAREAVADRYASKAVAAEQGRAIWIGYDSQGNGVVKQNGNTKIVKIEGRISLPPGSSVMVDRNGVVSVREPTQPPEKRKPVEIKREPRRVPKKNRSLILGAEEEQPLPLIDNIEYQLSTVWVSRISGWVYIYSSNAGLIGSYNLYNYFNGFEFNYSDLDNEAKSKLAQLKEDYFAEIYSDPEWEITNIFYTTVPRRRDVVVLTSPGKRMSCYIIDNKLYIVEPFLIEIESLFHHETYIFNTLSGLLFTDQEDFFLISIAILSGVSVYVLDLLTLEETHNVDFYLDQTLDASGLTGYFRIPLSQASRWEGSVSVNVISRDPDQVIKEIMPLNSLFRNCANPIWMRWDEDVVVIPGTGNEKPEFGTYVNTNSEYVGKLTTSDDDVPFFHTYLQYQNWVSSLVSSVYFRASQIDCFSRAFNVVANIDNPEELLDYYFRVSRIDIYLDGSEDNAVMAHAFPVADFDFCTQYMYLNSTWNGSIPEIGSEPSFASKVRDRTDYFYSGGLVATGDVSAFNVQSNLTAFLDPNSLIYGRDAVEVAPVVAQRIFDANDTDDLGSFFGQYALNLVSFGERVDFVGYILHEVKIE